MVLLASSRCILIIISPFSHLTAEEMQRSEDGAKGDGISDRKNPLFSMGNCHGRLKGSKRIQSSQDKMSILRSRRPLISQSSHSLAGHCMDSSLTMT